MTIRLQGMNWLDRIRAVALRQTGRPLSDAATFDAYQPAPLQRDEVAEIFSKELRPATTEERLRASERLERDTMAMIREGLYPST